MNKKEKKPSIETIINNILAVRKKVPGTPADITETDILYLCSTIKTIFLEQPVLLELQPPLTICGDTHGQFHDLVRIFEECKYPPHTNYLFLGDYVDRGIQSIETVCLLFAFKILYPENFFLLRGNHECSYINRQFGFYDECIQRFSKKVWRIFCDVFNCLPVAAIVDDKIFCVHGGISPTLLDLDDIKKIERPLEIPEDGLLCDLLWSDPDPDIEQWDDNDRGTSYIFGQAPLRRFLDRFNFDLLCRAHQAVMGGYDFPFADDQGVVTIFSAPNYCYEFQNKGAMLQVDENLYCTFKVLEPIIWEEEFFAESRPGTPPRGTSENTLTDLQL
ncbi:serine/threonine protein phosphatase Pzh1 [Tritrichomonas musculus]|uniref:Serine/threonine-protein phosphatase n=1 Tax=Tritrichomonas musculus TaxID=1915356 RepID=A0ABR2K396_9EUKA